MCIVFIFCFYLCAFMFMLCAAYWASTQLVGMELYTNKVDNKSFALFMHYSYDTIR